jgi:hypothetical protein
MNFQFKQLYLIFGLIVLTAIVFAFQEKAIEDFENISDWVAAPADGVKMELSTAPGYSGQALKIDFDYQGNSGWAALRKNFRINLPENYEFSFYIRGDAPITHFEFKLIDQSGQNVWWVNKRNFEYLKEWQQIVIKKRQIGFAWGPSGGGELQEISSIEFAITSAAGGKGSVYLDEITLRELPPVKPYTKIPQVTASSELSGYAASNALDKKLNTVWKSDKKNDQFYEIDFQQVREFGGMIIDWEREDFGGNYEIQISEDRNKWTTVRNVSNSNGGRDYLYLPETESQYVRIKLIQSNSENGFAIREIEIKPVEFASTPNSFFSAIAKDSQRGLFPRGFLGELSYWTIVGSNSANDEGLLNEDGAYEPSISSYSIEPFVFADGKLVTWNDVKTEQSLEAGYLPIPSIRWTYQSFFLDVKAMPFKVEYSLTNRIQRPTKFKLFLAIRPFQVNPPSQFLNTAGGTIPIRELKWDGNQIMVNRKFSIFPDKPTQFGAASFDEGDVIEYLHAGKVPDSSEVVDPFGYASGALAYDILLDSNAEKTITLSSLQQPPSENIAAWKQALNSVEIHVPENAMQLVNTLKSNLAYILINRDGPAIQPGSRAYARSWIRDGSLTSTALLRLGQSAAARDFIEWYGRYQYPNGKVPCCVDARGADPVPEHDSHGEFIYIIAEYYRHTKDREFLSRLWPNVIKAVEYMDALRKERRTAEFKTPEKQIFFGLLPESISHEGYSSKPVHSYWDDFFALRGMKDAVKIATVLNKKTEEKEFIAIHDEFKADLYNSLRHTIEHHKIDFIPGSADLGDFDATSTTITIVPGGELENLPRKELLQTFERYYQQSVQRATDSNWESYTPYELRNVGIFVRLGWRERAHELLQFFMQHQRPRAWNHWAEVVFREPRTPKFIGDMPHTWVGSDFIRSFLDFFGYERESDQSIILAAGIPADWVQSSDGISIRNLQTHYGPLTYSLNAIDNNVRFKISAGMEVPPGGIIVTWPLQGSPSRATINGIETSLAADQVTIKTLPADVILQK